MSEAVHNPQQEFWRPPSLNDVVAADIAVTPIPAFADTCGQCHAEFMIGARFCHVCGTERPEHGSRGANASGSYSRQLLRQKLLWLRSSVLELSKVTESIPSWLRYLHFHEIKRWIGLPTPSLIAFMLGLGCIFGAVGVSLFYKASNMAEFQAIQMWRIEWLLAATAAFVAAILLKRPIRRD